MIFYRHIIAALATVLCIVVILVAGRYSISSLFFTIGPDRSVMGVRYIELCYIIWSLSSLK
jgi:hypothetical protein